MTAYYTARGAWWLVGAIFHLAVCDYAEVDCNREQMDWPRVVNPVDHAEAAAFLWSPWADEVASWVNLEGDYMRRRAVETRAAADAHREELRRHRHAA